jgi:hypothetical protein
VASACRDAQSDVHVRASRRCNDHGIRITMLTRGKEGMEDIQIPGLQVSVETLAMFIDDVYFYEFGTSVVEQLRDDVLEEDFGTAIRAWMTKSIKRDIRKRLQMTLTEAGILQ